MPDGAATFASFAATHEDRLVRSVMSESGLSPDAAAAVAADVLPAAYERSFASCGAAYGWLRVAARHRAAGSTGWADAADTALCRADAARAVLAGLPAVDRELIRLRFVDGVLPDALAERFGLDLDDVLARLDRGCAAARAVGEATDATPVPLPRRAEPSGFSAPRAAAAAALVAAAVLGGVQSPPAHPPLANAPFPSTLALPRSVAAAADEVVAATPAGRAAAVAAAATRTTSARVVDLGAPPADTEPPTCLRNCGGSGGGFVDELHVTVPKQVADATGQREVVVEEAAGDLAHLCDVLAPVPAGTARCVRREH
ncbi:MAG TPA: hypothetical protein VNA20_03575 [Frankiaceae bacterium]|nr:hypothetical protein [Frankiaceae bacterium]